MTWFHRDFYMTSYDFKTGLTRIIGIILGYLWDLWCCNPSGVMGYAESPWKPQHFEFGISFSGFFRLAPADLPTTSKECSNNVLLVKIGLGRWLVYHRHHHLPVVIMGFVTPLYLSTNQWEFGTSMLTIYCGWAHLLPVDFLHFFSSRSILPGDPQG